MKHMKAASLLLLAAIVYTALPGGQATEIRKSIAGRVTNLKAAVAATSPGMTYHGGWVMGNADVIIIWYGGWTSTATVNTPSTISTMTKFLGSSAWYNVNR
jgi:hypothetical protein